MTMGPGRGLSRARCSATFPPNPLNLGTAHLDIYPLVTAGIDLVLTHGIIVSDSEPKIHLKDGVILVKNDDNKPESNISVQ